MNTWNDTAAQTMVTLFEQQVENTPDNIAIIFEQQALTYRQLNEQANALAHYLLRLKSQSGALLLADNPLVALVVERSLNSVMGLLAILKAGGAYLPIDSDYPADRIHYLLEDSRAPLLLTHRYLLAEWDYDGRVVCLDEVAVAHQSHQNPSINIPAQDLAYVIYTSGSTGKPKGVLVEHEAFALHCLAMLPQYQLQKSDRILAFASFNFDASLEQLFVPWLTGACSVVLKNNLLTAEDLLVFVKQHQLTVLDLPPAYWQQIIEMADIARELATVRILILGGEALPVSLAQKTRQLFPALNCFNSYGPTEAVITPTVYRLPMSLPKDISSIPIGKPRANTRVYILNAQLQPLPIGSAGELCIAGKGLARGYLNQPKLSAEKFTEVELFGKPERIYKTGDLARWLPDGNLEYLGRIDHQVKLRGFRIELGEIETLLSQHAAINAAVVTVYEAYGNKRLVAYLILNQEKFALEELRHWLKQRLPDYMIPSAFMVLDALPLNANGKIDRKALPAPLVHVSLAYEAPHNDIERQLLHIWQTLLNQDAMGIHDNFFALGGDSILSIQVVSSARQAGLQLTPRDLFEHQTIAELALAVGFSVAANAEQGLVTGNVPFTPIQQWFFTQNLPNWHYNQSVLLTVPPDLNIEALRQALAAVLLHHDALRLRYHLSEGQWQQAHAHEPAALPFYSEDLSDCDQPEQALLEVTQAYQQCLNISTGPITQMVLVKFKDSQRLFWCIHHLVIDGISWRILQEDLDTAYRQYLAGELLRLPAKTSSFKAWAERLVNYANSEAVNAERTFWQALPDLPLPLDNPAGKNFFEYQKNITINLSNTETLALLREVPSAYNTRINDILLTALVITLTDWTGQAQCLIDLEGHGRVPLFADIDFSRTVGWFTVIHPVAFIRESTDLATTLKAVKERLRSTPNDGIGYSLFKELHRENLPKADILFNYLGQFDQGTETGLFRMSDEALGNEISSLAANDHLLDINGAVTQGQLHLVWSYSSDCYHAQTIDTLAQNYKRTLQQLIAHCQQGRQGVTPSDFPLAQVTQSTLDQLYQQHTGLQDCYPLSPMQQGMLFHALYEPDSGMYLVQMRLTLSQLDPDAFKSAWHYQFQRHPILRTAFLIDQHPVLQIVDAEVSLQWREQDWIELAKDQQQTQLAVLLAEEKKQGFDLSTAPLMRFDLIRLDEQRYVFIQHSHHILLDGWCLPIMLNEVLDSYLAFKRGQTPQLPSVRPYRDYIAWLQQQDTAIAGQYWQQRLAGFITPTPLVIVNHKTATPIYREVSHTLTLAETEQLHHFSQSQRITLNTLIQGVWVLLLSGYSRETDICFGVTVSGRNAPLSGIEHMMGLFINTLPLRIQINPEDSVNHFLQQVQKQHQEDNLYAYSPLFEIQAASDMANGTGLFDSLLVFENYPLDSTLSADASAYQIEDVQDIESTNYPLTIAVIPSATLLFKISYDQQRISSNSIERLWGHLNTLLTTIIANPQQAIGCLSLLTAGEIQQLQAWNHTEITYPPANSIVDLFEQQAEKTPENIAVVFAQQALTYRQLNEKANQWAHYLLSLRTPEGTALLAHNPLIAIAVDRSLEMMIGLLAILKAGSAYLPIDPDYPATRLRYLLEDSRAPLLLTQSHYADIVALTVTYECVVLALDSTDVTPQASQNPCVNTGAQNLAYVIYTSGSTGQPKGVLVEQGNLLNSTLARQDYYQSNGATRLLLLPSFAFDAFGAGAFLTLSNGGSLYLPQNPSDINQLVSIIDAQKISHFVCTPTLYQELLRQMDKPLESLRGIIFGGEVSSHTLLKQHFTKMPQAGLFNEYGPTEATIWTTVFRYQTPHQAGNVIGRPIANTRIYLLNTRQQPQPLGIAGELCIAGLGLARGYLNQAELTSEKFIEVELFGQHERIYRTGDLARWLPDGNLEYLGRIDSQIKLRGFRIELGEIEALLNQHPAVNEAVVILYEADDNKRLLAYFTETGQGGEMLTTAVRSWLKARLPDYMIPAQFIVLDKLPVTTNGKINRKALPAPELNLLDVYEAPRNPIEQQLADIWSVLFKRDPIGIRDNFFSLGGNSILSMQMVVNAQQAGLQFTPRDLFEQQTIAELASVLSETQVRELGPTPRTDNANIPLSFGQHRLWLKQIAHPNHSTFNISDCFRLTGKLNKTALQQSFAEIIRRHEILHTVFPVQNGMPVQSIIATAPVTISLKELQGLPENAQLNAVRQWAMTKIACHFDLVNGPLLSINLMQLAEESHILLLCFHHIIMDFMSIGILLNELTSIYTAIVSSKPSPLSDLPIQFADYALWQQRVLTPEALDTKLNYWRTWLAKGEPPVLPLPTDRNRLKAGSLEADIAFYQLSPELLTELKRLSQRTGVTLYSVFLSALSVLLHSYSACEDMVVSSPVANRNHSSLEPLIGLMGSLLLLRIDLSGKPRITELLTEVQQVVLAAIANQDPPFEEVVKILQPERKRDTPLFRVLINFLPESPQKQFTLPDLTISSLPLDESEMNMDLVLAFWEEDRRLCGWWRYRKDIFDAKTIVRINKDFQTVLEAMVTAPEQRVDHLALNLKN